MSRPGDGESPGNSRDNSDYGAFLTCLGGHFGATLVYDEWRRAVTRGCTVRKFGGAISYESDP